MRPWLAVVVAATACGPLAVREPPMRRGPCAAPAAALAPAPPGPAVVGLGAVEGRPIHAVALTGAPPLARDAIVAALASRAGEPVSSADVRHDLKLLANLGIARTVAVSGRSTAAGVDLEYSLTPLPVIAQVVVAHPDPVVGELAALAGTLDDPIQVERLRRHAVARWQRLGFRDAAIAVRRARGPRGELLCVADAPGRRYVISRIEVIGGDAVPASEVVRLLGRRGGTVNARGGIYDPALLDASLDAIRTRYLDHGFSPTIATPVVDVDRARARLVIRLAIDQGARYHYGHVELPGPAGPALAARLGITPGRPYSQRAVEELRAALDTWADAHGRWIRLDLSWRHGHAVDLVITLSEPGGDAR